MGGTSKQTQTTDQSSTTNPWAPAQPLLSGILGQLNTGMAQTGITGAENSALNTITANAGNASQFAPQIGNLIGDLLNGGGVGAQSGNISQGLQDYQRRLGATADGSQIGANSGLNPYLNTISNDVQNRVNGMFAGAGRDMSGMNQQTLARGIAEGTAPVIANQYNQDVANQRGAADALYGAGNTTAGLLTGINQQGLANRQAGAQLAPAALDAQNAGANSVLQAEAARRGIPVQALGLLANIGIPIAGLGGQSTGQSTTRGENQMSGAQQFATIAGGLGSMFGGSGNRAAGGIARLISDRRAKEDIAQVGTLFDGTPVYRYRYIGQPAFQIGLMAQDVEKVTPEAVGQIGPFKAVDCKLATDKALEVA